MPETPPGWHPDTTGRFERRYWDGGQWTEHVATRGRPSTDPVQSPGGRAADWYRDPFGRHELRYWDGERWSEHVSNRGVQHVDPPVPPPPIPPPTTTPMPQPAPSGAAGKESRSIKRQVRRAGAGHVEASGGTLFTERVLVFNQKAKVIGSTLEYGVHDRDGRRLGTVREVPRGLGGRVSDKMRGREGRRRAYDFVIQDVSGAVLLTMQRPEPRGWGSTPLVVSGPDHYPYGQIRRASKMKGAVQAAREVDDDAGSSTLANMARRLSTAAKELDLLGGAKFALEVGDQQVGTILSANSRQWDFTVVDAGGFPIASITKTWAGWAKERFSSADNYVVDMQRDLGHPLRPLIIAAAVVIDFELKEFGQQTSGSGAWGSKRRYH